VARFGRLDVLVNNAGILLRGTVDDFDLADFDRMVAINIKAVFVATQAAIPHLQEGARIITTGSIAAERAGFPGASVYSMTKGRSLPSHADWPAILGRAASRSMQSNPAPRRRI
jgi:3-oxoacyl-[acyl-carrier protein] reductase